MKHLAQACASFPTHFWHTWGKEFPICHLAMPTAVTDSSVLRLRVLALGLTQAVQTVTWQKEQLELTHLHLQYELDTALRNSATQLASITEQLCILKVLIANVNFELAIDGSTPLGPTDSVTNLWWGNDISAMVQSGHVGQPEPDTGFPFVTVEQFDIYENFAQREDLGLIDTALADSELAYAAPTVDEFGPATPAADVAIPDDELHFPEPLVPRDVWTGDEPDSDEQQDTTMDVESPDAELDSTAEGPTPRGSVATALPPWRRHLSGEH